MGRARPGLELLHAYDVEEIIEPPIAQEPVLKPMPPLQSNLRHLSARSRKAPAIGMKAAWCMGMEGMQLSPPSLSLQLLKWWNKERQFLTEVPPRPWGQYRRSWS
jgi:hypothetical protein